MLCFHFEQAAADPVHCQIWSCTTRVLAQNLLMERENPKEIWQNTTLVLLVACITVSE